MEERQDLISRREAIDKINERQRKLIYCFGFENDMVKIMNIVKSIIIAIPPAQPEIVRCKDCKHYGCILHSGTQFEYGECFGREEPQYTFEVKPDDFCSRAERRTNE